MNEILQIILPRKDRHYTGSVPSCRDDWWNLDSLSCWKNSRWLYRRHSFTQLF